MKKYTLSKDKIKILLLEGIHPSAESYFRRNGYTNIEKHKKALDDTALAEKLRDTHILGIRSRTMLDSQLLKKANKLFCVGCFCIGTNQVELDKSKSLGVPVFNAPFSNTRSVAELVVAEIVMLMRGVSEKNILAHQGKWLKSTTHSHEVRGKTLGIVGYGHIGSQVAVLAESFGMNVLYYDIEKRLSIGNSQVCSSLKELLSSADVVTLHVPATPLTQNMIGARELKQMRKGAFLINAARGNIVDIAALTNAMDKKYIAGAAIDVFPEEPASNQDRFSSVLQPYNNVILTPHIGGSTEEAQENIANEVAEKLVRYSDNGSTTGSVNFVQISLPSHEGKNRFLHIHKNMPGILESVNNIFSSRGINIASQYLQTDSEIGYLICDVEGKIDRKITGELKKIPHTIRSRVLY